MKKYKVKKSQLRNIIKESIKQLMTEQGTTNIHIYQGCHLSSGTSTGVGNHWGIPQSGWQGFTANQGAPGGTYPYQSSLQNTMQPPPASTVAAYEAYLTYNSDVLHNLWNTPSVGQVIRFCTCDDFELNPQCECTCLKYLGESDNYDSWAPGAIQQIGFMPWQNLQPQPNQVFNSCQDCSDVVIYNEGPGCTDQNANNYMQCCPDANGVVDPGCTVTSGAECCDYGPPEPGCVGLANQQASNYGECCSGVPGCIPTSHDQDCCNWGNTKGCLDPTALNGPGSTSFPNGQCCGIMTPNCDPAFPNPDCCKYDDIEPLPCKKCCCKAADIIHPVAGDDELKEQVSIGGCKPGTTIMLNPQTDPCECPAGFIETICKLGASTPDDEIEKLQKRANIIK